MAMHSPAAGLAGLAAVAAFLSLQVTAQAGPCLPASQPLLKIPEIVSGNDKVLRGTIVLTDEQRRLLFRSPGTRPGQPGSLFDCVPQRVRAFIGLEAMPKVPPSPGGIIDPYPGPTLRARLGDVVKLTFVNLIDPGRFPYSIDQGEKRRGGTTDPASGCDISSPGDPKAGYPLLGGDAFPDCFHGSSTGNIHFHGTHTNPDSTADNVLLEIRPTPLDGADRTVEAMSARANRTFEDFFKACEAQLRANVLSTFPQTWNDAPLGPWTTPGTWTAEQAKALQDYDNRTGQDLWGTNKRQIDRNAWPQNYIGAYPYCFGIPEYKQTTWPPPLGSGSPIMGQAPGTHWYHAHKHGSTAINVANGMTGVFIIEGDYDDKLNTFYGTGWTRTQPVMVINQLGVSPNLLRQPSAGGGPGAGSQDKGPEFSVNGRSQPVVAMAPGEVQMWRIANTSGRSAAYFGGIAPGLQWMQLAQDGVQFTYDNYQKSQNRPFMMASGNRVDLLVKAPPTPGTYPVLVQHAVDRSDLATASPVVLFQVVVSGDPATGRRAQFIDQANFPQQPPFLANIGNAEVTGGMSDGVRVGTITNPRVITFASTPPTFTATPTGGQTYAMHTINGLKFDSQNPKDYLRLTLGSVEEWKIVNETYGPAISHPFHIHINPFQIVEVFDPNATVNDPNLGTVPKYFFTTLPKAANVQPPSNLQCVVNLNDRETWTDCNRDTSNNPRIWWDVFPIPSGRQVSVTNMQLISADTPLNPVAQGSYNVPGYIKIRSRFVDFAGQYVLHCHILAHEDRGMMMMVQVSGAGKTIEPGLYRHH
jgi:FtsP/CotA-like multicopper oxidase with cupredoxin domain